LATGSGVHAKAVIIAHLSFARRFGHEMKKRAITKAQIKNFKVNTTYNGLIVVDYFLLRKKEYRDLRA
jgi:hypothetical protein